MTSQRTSRRAGKAIRARATTLGLVAVASLVFTGLLAAPANAATGQQDSQRVEQAASQEPNPGLVGRESASDKPGYSKVTSRESYLRFHTARGVEILHVDNDHADANGFWFAQKSALSRRGWDWTYQPYGMWCQNDVNKVTFNGYMNTHWCEVDRDAFTAQYGPWWAQNTDACRTSSGLGWRVGSMFEGDASCADLLIDGASNSVQQEGAAGYTCAPWEEQGLNPNGSAKCLEQTYDWVDDEPNTFWMPAPDTCTQMPADSNRRSPSPRPVDYAPQSGDGTCTGADLAPNCADAGARMVSQACTGVPEAPPVTASATETVTVDGVEGTATRSATAQRTVNRGTVTKRVIKKMRGRTFRAKGSARMMVTREATEEATTTVRNGSAQATQSATCSGADMAAAQACATEKAREQATQVAQGRAEDRAEGEAAKRATSQAKRAAGASALKAARTADTKWVRKAAERKAKQAALRKVWRQIKRSR